MKIIDIYKAIDEKAPFDTALDFDNVGILVGDKNAEVHKVLLALDITLPVVREAATLGADLIVSHHPIIFNPLKKLTAGTAVYALASGGIGAVCCHTNVDFSMEIGTNRALADALEFENFTHEGDCLFSGTLRNEMTASEFASFVSEKLKSPYITYTDSDKIIRKVGFCSGAGGEFVYAAADCCDAYLTGEARHHELLFAKEQNLPMFVAGHYATERIFAPFMQKYLSEKFPEVEFIISTADTDPVTALK